MKNDEMNKQKMNNMKEDDTELNTMVRKLLRRLKKTLKERK